MEEDKELKNAVGSFVESLEKEHKNNKLIEDNSEKKEYRQADSFFELVSKLKKIIAMVCIGEEIRIETDEKPKTAPLDMGVEERIPLKQGLKHPDIRADLRSVTR